MTWPSPPPRCRPPSARDRDVDPATPLPAAPEAGAAGAVRGDRRQRQSRSPPPGGPQGAEPARNVRRQSRVPARGASSSASQSWFQRRLNTTTDPKWLVGAELQWKLFDGFGREHRVAAASLAEQEVGTPARRRAPGRGHPGAVPLRRVRLGGRPVHVAAILPRPRRREPPLGATRLCRGGRHFPRRSWTPSWRCRASRSSASTPSMTR